MIFNHQWCILDSPWLYLLYNKILNDKYIAFIPGWKRKLWSREPSWPEEHSFQNWGRFSLGTSVSTPSSSYDRKIVKNSVISQTLTHSPMIVIVKSDRSLSLWRGENEAAVGIRFGDTEVDTFLRTYWFILGMRWQTMALQWNKPYQRDNRCEIEWL